MKETIKEFVIIVMHNHPLIFLACDSDLAVCWERKYKYGVIVWHDGTIYKYSINHDIIEMKEDMEEAIFHYQNTNKKFEEKGDSNVFFTEENKRELQKMGILLERMEG